MDPLIGQIIMFGGSFAPRGWALCDGRLLDINTHAQLFTVLGTTYGGDGRTTFGLPDLRGRVPMHAGTGAGLTPRQLGEKAGAERLALSAAQLPGHTHGARIDGVETLPAAGGGDPSLACSDLMLGTSGGGDPYDDPTATARRVGPAPAVTVDPAGDGAPVDIVQPFQVVNFIIALQGTYPTRN